MQIKPLVSNMDTGVLKSLFQEDFSCVKEQIEIVLEHNPDKTKLFEIIFCEHFQKIKKCQDVKLKLTALKNVVMALSYLGEQ